MPGIDTTMSPFLSVENLEVRIGPVDPYERTMNHIETLNIQREQAGELPEGLPLIDEYTIDE
jgi:hypothetical protein